MSSDPESAPIKVPASPVAGAEAFKDEFNESLSAILNIDSWRTNRNPEEEYQLIERQVQRAAERETTQQKRLRDQIHPLLAKSESAPPHAGVHKVRIEEIIDTQRCLLFNGAVEACDGNNDTHDSLALTIYQIGVSLVSYQGDRGCWHQRLFRRDLEQRYPDPALEVMDLLEKRGRGGGVRARGSRGGLSPQQEDELSELVQRGLMSYAERAVLANRSQARWRMGHGSPAPLELIVAAFTDLAVESIKVIRKLVEHERFVFIASEPRRRDLLTIGQSLLPLEYAIVGTLPDLISHHLEDWAPTHPATVDLAWDGLVLPAQDWVKRFRDEIAPRIVYGLYRATEPGPPQLFYAHVDHSAVAARIAIADSVFLEERGFPLLIDLADRMCRSVYGGGSLREMAESAYAAAEVPFRYGSERRTRNG